MAIVEHFTNAAYVYALFYLPQMAIVEHFRNAAYKHPDAPAPNGNC